MPTTRELLRWGLDPAEMMAACGLPCDPWQAELLRSDAGRVLLLAARQVGKTATVAAMALHRTLFFPGSLTLCLSPTLRQSSLLFSRIVGYDDALGRPAGRARATATTLEAANGSVVVSLPG